jgi:hypothetical protein
VDPVGFFSMEVCLQERFHYNAIVFGPDLANQVRAAQKDNAVVIMIVDLWSLKIPSPPNNCHPIMRSQHSVWRELRSTRG